MEENNSNKITDNKDNSDNTNNTDNIFNGPYELEKLIENPDNKYCFDCGSSGINGPQYVSVNNAIFLCVKCAGVHKGFGINVSIVRSLKLDTLEDKEIKLLCIGGNKRFRKFLNEYSVPDKADPEFIYFINAAEYYRKLLKYESTDKHDKITPSIPVKPDILKGLDLISNSYYENNYDHFKPIITTDFEEIPKSKQKPETSFFGRMSSYFEEKGKSIGEAAMNLGSKVGELNIRDKLSKAGSKTFEAFKSAGDKIADTSKDIMHSTFVQSIANSTESGISSIVETTKKIFDKTQELGNEGEEDSEIQISPNEVLSVVYHDLDKNNFTDIPNNQTESVNKSQEIKEGISNENKIKNSESTFQISKELIDDEHNEEHTN